MSHRVPKLGFAAGALLFLLSLPFLAFIITKTGGPTPFSSPYTLHATLKDSQQVDVRSSPVLLRGVPAGNIVKVVAGPGGRARVSIEFPSKYAHFYRDATLQVATRSALSDPALEVDPGHPQAGKLRSGSELPPKQVLANVEIEEALTILNESGHGDLRSLQRTTGRAVQDPRAPAQERAGLTALRRFVSEARNTVEILHGQEEDISGVTTNGEAVLEELGRREQTLNRLVSGARTTLESIESVDRSFAAGFDELPRLLESSRRALAGARPLFVESRPLVSELRTAAPELTPALRDLRPTMRDARRTVDDLPAFVHDAVPTLRRTLPVLRLARPVARRSGPALRNLEPALRYMAPYKEVYSSFFANSYDGAAGKDNSGYYVRFQFINTPLMAQGIQDPNHKFFHINNYAPPDNLLARPEGYKYPRLMPFPAPPETKAP
jgi:phospholipid/cholesterol/gamma-HCH transport system substrate-binding protein